MYRDNNESWKDLAALENRDHHEASGADKDVDVWMTKCVPSKKVCIAYLDALDDFEVEVKPKESNEVHLASLDEQKCVNHDCHGIVDGFGGLGHADTNDTPGGTGTDDSPLLPPGGGVGGGV